MRTQQDAAEPIRPNMTPMIDVVFQLIVFFLVSMRFKALDEMLQTPLRDGGPGIAPPSQPPLFVDLRASVPDGTVRLVVNRAEFGTVSITGGSRLHPTWTRFAGHVALVRRRAIDAGAPPVRAEIDASPGVRTGTVVAALDVLKGAGVEDVRFRGTPPAR